MVSFLSRVPLSSDSLLSLGLDSGALIAVPIPEAFRNLGNEIEQATHQALSDAA